MLDISHVRGSMVRMEIVFWVYSVKALESLGVECGGY